MCVRECVHSQARANVGVYVCTYNCLYATL